MSSQKTHYVIATLVILIVAGIAVWYVVSQSGPAPVASSVPVVAPETKPPAPAVAVTTSSLGATLYEKSQNPIQNKVPEIAPTANPIKNVYKNPFE